MRDGGTKDFDWIGVLHSTTGCGSFAAKPIEEGPRACGKPLVANEAATLSQRPHAADAEAARRTRLAGAQCSRILQPLVDNCLG